MKQNLGFVSVLVLIVTLFIVLANCISIEYDICVWQESARSADNAEEMAVSLQKLKLGMEKWNMTTGYLILSRKSPDKDMSLLYRAVNIFLNRAQRTAKLDIRSEEYSEEMTVLRFGISGLNLMSQAFWASHEGLILFILMLVSVAMLLILFYSG